jgi:hypothetical protein
MRPFDGAISRRPIALWLTAMKPRLVLVLLALLVPLAGFAIWKLTPRPSSSLDKPPPAQTFNYVPSGRSKAGIPLRPMDTDIFEAITKNHLTLERAMDLFPDRPYHVKLVADLQSQRVLGALIDLDRDGRWDERWQMRTDGCTRTPLSTKNGDGSRSFNLVDGHWVAF